MIYFHINVEAEEGTKRLRGSALTTKIEIAMETNIRLC